MSLDDEKNPLLKTVQGGKYKLKGVASMSKKFLKDLKRLDKKHASISLLQSVLKNYKLSSGPSEELSQVQYIHVTLWNQW